MTGGVIAVERAIELLNAFRWGDEGLSLAEMSNRTGLHKSTILRLAVSLQNTGMLSRSAAGEFRLGANILKLSAILRASLRLDKEALPYLTALSERCKESASLFIRDGNSRICLVRVEAAQSVVDSARRGLPLPLDDTSAGLVLRGLGGTFVGGESGPFRPIFTSGVTDPHTASLSAPVLDADGAILGAMTVSGPAYRLTRDAADHAAPQLVDAARALSASLGYRGDVPAGDGRPPPKQRRPTQARGG